MNLLPFVCVVLVWTSLTLWHQGSSHICVLLFVWAHYTVPCSNFSFFCWSISKTYNAICSTNLNCACRYILAVVSHINASVIVLFLPFMRTFTHDLKDCRWIPHILVLCPQPYLHTFPENSILCFSWSNWITPWNVSTAFKELDGTYSRCCFGCTHANRVSKAIVLMCRPRCLALACR